MNGKKARVLRRERLMEAELRRPLVLDQMRESDLFSDTEIELWDAHFRKHPEAALSSTFLSTLYNSQVRRHANEALAEARRRGMEVVTYYS